jgi:hypothetical protein
MRPAQDVRASRPLRRFKVSGWPAPDPRKPLLVPGAISGRASFQWFAAPFPSDWAAGRLKSDPPTISQSYPPAPVALTTI